MLLFISAIFGLCVWASVKLSPQLAWTELDFDVPRGAAWSRQIVSPSTSKALPRRLILYRQVSPFPTSDWRMEFYWKSESTGIGLIVRCSDRRNYSAIRLRPIVDGFSEESFRVVEGAEGSHSLKKIVFPKSNPDLHLALEETGPEVTLRLGQENIDRWTERQLTPDRIGFFEDRNEKVAAHAIQISVRNHPSLRVILVEAERIARIWWNSLLALRIS